MREITVVGGGLAGLISAILLKRSGRDVLLIEKKKYPFHKVCGEYISNEVRPFLKQHGLFPEGIPIASIDTFTLSSTRGKSASMPLDLGGFGISRYALDHFLYEQALASEVDFKQETVNDINYQQNHFTLELKNGCKIESQFVIGAHGKRSKIDKALQRAFIQKRSPYIGVKYHILYDQPAHEVALHNFEGGYCGINKVENNKVNLCYLSSRENLKNHGNIPAMEKAVLSKNPHLYKIFNEAKFLFDQPEVINEISFETKNPVENHMLMCGDAAGMITPLCGNGMAMAIHSAKKLSECLIAGFEKGQSRETIEMNYKRQWTHLFARRLAIGRSLQKLFGGGFLSGLSVGILKNVKPLGHFLVEKTHGKPF